MTRDEAIAAARDYWKTHPDIRLYLIHAAETDDYGVSGFERFEGGDEYWITCVGKAMRGGWLWQPVLSRPLPPHPDSPVLAGEAATAVYERVEEIV